MNKIKIIMETGSKNCVYKHQFYLTEFVVNLLLKSNGHIFDIQNTDNIKEIK